jgi:flagellar hook-basal body complex protein FliE
MSNFDLPPLLGFDPLQRPRLPLAGVAGLEPGMRPQLVGETTPPTDNGVPELAPEGGRRFESVLDSSVGTLNDLQADVRSKVRGLVLGEGVELHDVMLAINKSEVSFNLMLEVRNKLVDAWDKLSRSVN